MKSVRQQGPFVVHCTREGCDQTRDVTSAWKQQRQKFCSHRCANMRHRLNYDDRVRGAARSKVVRRMRAIERLRGLTPLEIFRTGYKVGWKAGVRGERRRTGVAA